MKSAVFAIAALGLLCGCSGESAIPGKKIDAAAKAAFPLSFEQTSPDAEVKLTIAPEIAEWPALHKKLYTEAVEQLRKFAADAPELRADNASGGASAPALGQEITWSLAASNPRLVSIMALNYEYTGGAHPNHGYDALLWDAVNQIEIKKDELFLPRGAADETVKAALCDGIKKARIAKGVEPDPGYDEAWPCPDWRAPDFVLAPSTVPGKFGGIIFIFSPYEIGSYAEGEYEVAVPQEIMRPVFKPAWRGEFAGAPKTVTPAKP